MIEPNLSHEEYRKRPGVHSSLLKIVDEDSLAHAKAYLDGRRKVTAEMTFGTSFHSLVLDGVKDYAIQPETYIAEDGKDAGKVKPWSNNANVCKAWVAAQGKPVLTAQDDADLCAMVESVRSCRALDGLLSGQRELSVFAEHQDIPVKARIDLLTDGDGPVLDFKKTRDANPEAFMRDALQRRYHVQAAWYLDCLRWAEVKRKEFWLVAVEDVAPYAVSVLRFSDAPLTFLRVGRTRYRAAFAKLKEAYATGHWPDYGAHSAEDYAKPWNVEELEATA